MTAMKFAFQNMKTLRKHERKLSSFTKKKIQEKTGYILIGSENNIKLTKRELEQARKRYQWIRPSNTVFDIVLNLAKKESKLQTLRA